MLALKDDATSALRASPILPGSGEMGLWALCMSVLTGARKGSCREQAEEWWEQDSLPPPSAHFSSMLPHNPCHSKLKVKLLIKSHSTKWGSCSVLLHIWKLRPTSAKQNIWHLTRWLCVSLQTALWLNPAFSFRFSVSEETESQAC